MIAIHEQEFKQFACYIKSHYGIHLKSEKKTLIEGRLGSVIASMNMDSLTDYLEYVKSDCSGQAASIMLDRITTNYTFFMREPAHFQFFKQMVLPRLADTVRDKDLRIWSAACATGEEPYSLAMLIDEFFGVHKSEWDTTLLATDLSQGALATAKAGIYSNDHIADLPGAWRKKYFNAYDTERSILSEQIRKEVIFSNLNLMTPKFPFRKNMHVIFCRNVMIYFDSETKEKLIQRLYDITEPGGFLFIGHSEGLNRARTPYKYIMPAVYMKE